MAKYRIITCPRCGAEVKIPFYWTLGLEGIFRCRTCQLRFKTGYKMGALLSALALTCSITTAQLAVYLCTSYSLALFAVLIFPLWIAYGYTFRRAYLLHKAKKYARLHPITEEELNPAGAPLPKDVAFEESHPVHMPPRSANDELIHAARHIEEDDCEFEIVYASEKETPNTDAKKSDSTQEEPLENDCRF